MKAAKFICLLIRHRILLFLCVLLPFISRSQFNNLKFEHLRVTDGLPDETVSCILQDVKGFMWFGTYRGLCRYDGYEFEVFQYQEDNPNSLHHNMISCIAEDHNGIIWIGSSAMGLGSYDPNSDQFNYYPASLEDSALVTNPSVRVIFEDSRHQLWVGTDFGLSVISPDRTTAKKYFCFEDPCTTPLNGKQVFDITEDNQGRIWIGTEGKDLVLYTPGSESFQQVKYMNLPLNRSYDHILKSFHIQHDSLLWIISNNGGLSRLNTIDFSYRNWNSYDEEGISGMHIRDLISDQENLWMAMDGNGLDLFNTKTYQVQNFGTSPYQSNTLSTHILWSLYKDQQDIIWIGSYQGGVNKYDPHENSFSLLGHNPEQTSSLPNKPVLSLYQSEDDIIWVGTDWGGMVALYPDGKSRHFEYSDDANGLSTNVVKSIAQDRHGNLLIGTFNHGFSQYDSQRDKFTHYREADEPEGLSNDNVWTLFTDSDGISWIGTLGGGLLTFDPDTKTISPVKLDYKAGGQYNIYQVLEDTQRNLWFSTDGGILFFERRTSEWQSYSIIDWVGKVIPDLEQVRGVVEDRQQNFWVATGAGLIKYDPKLDSAFLFDLNDDLVELPLLNITKDDNEKLLLISRTYISHFDILDHSATHYQIEDNAFNYNTLLKSRDGMVMVGGTNGITSFKPEALRPNDYLPQVYITNVEVPDNQALIDYDQNRSLLNDEHLTLAYDHTSITIRYTAINFSETSRNQFKYRLKGFDDTWKSSRTQRFATYTNLDPGEYVFEVKAANNHGHWNEVGAVLSVTVIPPFWQTWSFRILLVMLLSLIVYFLLRIRLQQVRKSYENERLRNEQELIKIKSEGLKKELNSTRKDLDNITMNYLHNNQKMQTIRQRIDETINGKKEVEAYRLVRIVKEIDKEIQDNEYWDNFEHQFNQSHDNFLERFKQAHPDLSKRELRLCAYLRMGLDNQKIATLMNVTVRTVETSRYRIRKKINLEERQSFTKMILRF